MTAERFENLVSYWKEMLKINGYPISDKIIDFIKFNESTSYFGMCTKDKITNKYQLKFSIFLLRLSDQAIQNTIIHELLHTVPNGMCHTGEWKKYALKVKRDFGFDIKRIGGDKSPEDLASFRENKKTKVNRSQNIYIIKCQDCGQIFIYRKMTKALKNILANNTAGYHCGKCNSSNLVFLDKNSHEYKLAANLI